MRLLKEIRNLMGNYHVKSGIYHYYRNEFKQAVEFFGKALSDEPSMTDSDRRTARYYLTMTFMTSAERQEENGDLEAATHDYEQAIRVSPTYPDLRYRFGRVLERLERIDDAIEQFRRAVSCQKTYLEAQVALAFCLLRAERGEEAAEAMRRALELRVQRIREPFDQAMELLAHGGDRAETEQLFQVAFLSEPQKFEEHFRSALEHLKAERYEDALAELDRSVELNPRYPDLHNFRGVALCELDRLDEGIEAFRDATAMKPEWRIPWLNLAFALLRGGRAKEAEAELEAILERDPTEPAAMAKLEELQTGRAPERRRSTARGVSP
jgi:tetratricopeptide (TPR) repeat protein